jgi:hypothetical protein
VDGDKQQELRRIMATLQEAHEAIKGVFTEAYRVQQAQEKVHRAQEEVHQAQQEEDRVQKEDRVQEEVRTNIDAHFNTLSKLFPK